jgi:hypothetical protein
MLEPDEGRTGQPQRPADRTGKAPPRRPCRAVAAPKIEAMRGKGLSLAFVYMIAGAVMLGVMIVLIVLGHLLAAGLACLAAIAGLLSAVGRLTAIRGEDPDQ